MRQPAPYLPRRGKIKQIGLNYIDYLRQEYNRRPSLELSNLIYEYDKKRLNNSNGK